MGSLDLDGIQKPRRTPQQSPTGKGQFRNRVIPPFVQDAGTVGNARTAFEMFGDVRMGLPFLKFLVGVQIRILVIQTDDQSGQYEIRFLMIQKGSTVDVIHRRRLQRISQCVLYQTLLKYRFRYLPHFLDTQTVRLRLNLALLAVVAITTFFSPQIKMFDQKFRTRPPRPFGKQRLPRVQFDTSFERRFGRPILGNPHVSRGNALDSTSTSITIISTIFASIVLHQHFRRRKSRINLHTHLFRT
mmetsp:Transcript_109706/g.164043  ORF Transcript_109706/g.164043 Transcript_109706/m.164043 type:complete len:244 (-) Transcript_109706:42-773(-)